MFIFFLTVQNSKNTPFYDIVLRKIVDSISNINLSALHGSISCFKLFMIDEDDISSCLDYALFGGNLEILQILEQNDVSFKTSLSTLLRAPQFHKDIFDWILNTKEVTPALENAIISRQDYAIQRFFELFPDIGNLSPPHMIPLAIYRNLDSLVPDLIKFGFDINAHMPIRRNSTNHTYGEYGGKTALHFAANKGNVELFQQLLENGARLTELESCEYLNPISFVVDSYAKDLLGFVQMNDVIH